jgi:hypothetical protein
MKDGGEGQEGQPAVGNEDLGATVLSAAKHALAGRDRGAARSVVIPGPDRDVVLAALANSSERGSTGDIPGFAG